MIGVDDLPIAPPHVYTKIGPNSWTVPSITDLHEPEHRVDLLAGRLYCSCIGFEVHKHCYHLDEVWFEVGPRCQNRDDNPVSREKPHSIFCDGCIAMMSTHEPTDEEHAVDVAALNRIFGGNWE